CLTVRQAIAVEQILNKQQFIVQADARFDVADSLRSFWSRTRLKRWIVRSYRRRYCRRGCFSLFRQTIVKAHRPLFYAHLLFLNRYLVYDRSDCLAARSQCLLYGSFLGLLLRSRTCRWWVVVERSALGRHNGRLLRRLIDYRCILVHRFLFSGSFFNGWCRPVYRLLCGALLSRLLLWCFSYVFSSCLFFIPIRI